MKTLNKILKILQSITKIDFKNKSVSLAKNESFSNNSESLLILINGEEQEFLFI